MRIRKAQIKDSVELSKLRKSTIRNVNKYDYSAEQIVHWSRRGSAEKFQKTHSETIRYVATQDEKIVGFADVDKKRLHEMGALYVHKDFLRQGIGTRLMEKIEEAVKKKGVKRFELRASVTAKPFYESLGYNVISYTKNDKKGDEFLMEKFL